MREALSTLIAEVTDGAGRVEVDAADPDGQTLLLWYPEAEPRDDAYLRPAVRIESGAKSARDPNRLATIRPSIADEVRMRCGQRGIANGLPPFEGTKLLRRARPTVAGYILPFDGGRTGAAFDDSDVLRHPFHAITLNPYPVSDPNVRSLHRFRRGRCPDPPGATIGQRQIDVCGRLGTLATGIGEAANLDETACYPGIEIRPRRCPSPFVADTASGRSSGTADDGSRPEPKHHIPRGVENPGSTHSAEARIPCV